MHEAYPAVRFNPLGHMILHSTNPTMPCMLLFCTDYMHSKSSAHSFITNRMQKKSRGPIASHHRAQYMLHGTRQIARHSTAAYVPSAPCGEGTNARYMGCSKTGHGERGGQSLDLLAQGLEVSPVAAGGLNILLVVLQLAWGWGVGHTVLGNHHSPAHIMGKQQMILEKSGMEPGVGGTASCMTCL